MCIKQKCYTPLHFGSLSSYLKSFQCISWGHFLYTKGPSLYFTVLISDLYKQSADILWMLWPSLNYSFGLVVSCLQANVCLIIFTCPRYSSQPCIMLMFLFLYSLGAIKCSEVLRNVEKLIFLHLAYTNWRTEAFIQTVFTIYYLKKLKYVNKHFNYLYDWLSKFK